MTKSKSLVYFFGFGLVFGIVFREASLLAINFLELCFFLTCVLILRGYFFRQSTPRTWLPIALILVGYSCGVYRTDAELNSYERSMRTIRSDTVHTITGHVSSDVSLGAKDRRVTILVDTIDATEIAEDVYIKATVHSGSLIEYGDVVRVEGKLQIPKNFVSLETGRAVPYEKIMLAQGVHGTLMFPRIEKIGYEPKSFLIAKLYMLKHAYIRALESNIREPAASLGIGITIGGDERLHKDIQEMFKASGLSHIVVLSGYNIAVMLGVLGILCSRLSRFTRAWVYTLCIIIFIVTTGITPPAVRAGIMGLILFYAHLLQRRANALHALTVAVIAMLCLHPLSVHDISFQLSVLATAGVLLFADDVARGATFLGKTLSEIVGATFAALLFVSPLILYSFGTFSFVALFANILILPMVPIAMGTTFLAGTIGVLIPVLVFPFAIVAQLVLDTILFCVFFVSTIPGASTSVAPFSIWLMVGMYICVAYVGYRIHRLHT